DREQRFRLVNAAFRAWFGDVRGKHVRDVVGDAGYRRIRDKIERALAGERVRFETRTAFRATPRWLQVEYVPDADPAGEVRGYVVQVQDITDHKRAQERLAHIVEASTVMSASVDQDATARAITQSVVSAL